MPQPPHAARAATRSAPRPCRSAPIESVAQAGLRIAWTSPRRRYATAPSVSRARPQAVPKPIAASLQLKPLLAATVTIRGRRAVAVGWPCFVLVRSARAQYWWHIPGAACTTVGCSLAREGVPGPHRPAAAAAGTRAATARANARACRRRGAWRCMGSPFVRRRGLRRQRCSSPVADRLFTVERRLRFASGVA
jgi:hypothetical protein